MHTLKLKVGKLGFWLRIHSIVAVDRDWFCYRVCVFFFILSFAREVQFWIEFFNSVFHALKIFIFAESGEYLIGTSKTLST